MNGYSNYRQGMCDGYASAAMLQQPEAMPAYHHENLAPPKMPPLAEAVSEAESRLKRLETIAIDLCDKLQPVLAIVPESPNGPPVYPAGVAPMIDVMNGISARVNAIADRLQSARERLVL